jgi:hypothetical protein
MRNILCVLVLSVLAGCISNPVEIMPVPEDRPIPLPIVLAVNNPSTSLNQVQTMCSVKSTDSRATYGSVLGTLATGGANDSTSLETESLSVNLPGNDIYRLEIALVVLGPNDLNRTGTWSTLTYLPQGSHRIVFSYIRFCQLDAVGCTGYLGSVAVNLR